MTLLRDERGRLTGGHWRASQPFREIEWLRREYVEAGRSAGDIAAEFGVTDAAVLYWLRKHGIPRRTVSDARKLKRWGASGAANGMFGVRGRLNPNYRGGSTPERQAFYASAEWREAVRVVRARDGMRCRECGRGSTDPRGIHLHHVLSFAEHPDLRADPENLMTLCRSCHHAAHRKSEGR